MKIVRNLAGEEFYVSGKHVDEYRTEDMPGTGQAKPHMFSERRFEIYRERQVIAQLNRERELLGMSRLLHDIRSI